MFVTGLYIDGNRITRVQVNTNSNSSISSMIDGTIDAVTRTTQDGQMFSVFVNDTGLFSDFKMNPIASIVAGSYLVGPAVITGTAPNGETISVPLSVIAHATSILETMALHQAFGSSDQLRV